jgi:hypothetical protein
MPDCRRIPLVGQSDQLSAKSFKASSKPRFHHLSGTVNALRARREPQETNEPSTLNKTVILCFTLASAAPIITVISSSSTITNALPNVGCLPDGTFAFPGQTSIWNPNQFLSIDIQANSQPWSFAPAKTVDIIWDLFIGRGLQVVLTALCLKIFSQALQRIMEDEEVPFRTYSAVSFEPVSLFSILSVCAAMRSLKVKTEELVVENGPTPRSLRRSSKARAVLVTMALLTLFVAAVPTLLSASTGYTSESYPTLSYYRDTYENADTVAATITSTACGSAAGRDYMQPGLLPAWGAIYDGLRVYKMPAYYVISYEVDTTSSGDAQAYRDCKSSCLISAAA